MLGRESAEGWGGEGGYAWMLARDARLPDSVPCGRLRIFSARIMGVVYRYPAGQSQQQGGPGRV